MAFQCEASTITNQTHRVHSGKVVPISTSHPEHPAMLTLIHLSSIYQHLQACFDGVNACKMTTEKFEHAYRQENHKLKDLRKQYDTLAGDNQDYERLFHQYQDFHKEMQKYTQSSEDSNREYKSRIKDLERENQEAKEELRVALIKVMELEENVVTDARSPDPQSPMISKRQRCTDLNVDAGLEPEESCASILNRWMRRKQR